MTTRRGFRQGSSQHVSEAYQRVPQRIFEGSHNVGSPCVPFRDAKSVRGYPQRVSDIRNAFPVNDRKVPQSIGNKVLGLPGE